MLFPAINIWQAVFAARLALRGANLSENCHPRPQTRRRLLKIISGSDENSIYELTQDMRWTDEEGGLF